MCQGVHEGGLAGSAVVTVYITYCARVSETDVYTTNFNYRHVVVVVIVEATKAVVVQLRNP